MIISTCGDCGDIVFALAILKELGGMHTILIKQPSSSSHVKDINGLYAAVSGLCEAQPYITECRIMRPGEHVDWHSENWRAMPLNYNTLTLVKKHLASLIAEKNIGRGISGKQKWLRAIPSPKSKGRVVMARSFRYQNIYFPWHKIIEFYGSRLLFVGLPYEHEAFCKNYSHVDFQPTRNLLHLSQIIAGSELFIGNQSSPNAIAEGLKHNLIQETCLHIPDCIYLRPNAQHVSDGVMTLPDVTSSGTLSLGSARVPALRIDEQKTPPGMWQYGGRSHSLLGALVDMFWNDEKRARSKEDVKKDIIKANAERLPDYFRDDSSKYALATFHEAVANAA